MLEKETKYIRGNEHRVQWTLLHQIQVVLTTIKYINLI